MRLVLLICAVVLVLPGALRADMVVELDLNGFLGDGPDSVAVALGDSLQVDVWIVGDDFPIDHFAICMTDDDLLDVLGAEIVLPWPWVPWHVYENGDTIVVAAHILNHPCEPGPTLHGARVSYRAAGEGNAPIEVDLKRSRYQCFDPSYSFTGYIGAVVEIVPPTSTGSRSWGSIKSLFR
jgi:hypothetical protein